MEFFKKYLVKLLALALSILFTGLLVESAGINASQANIFAFSNFSVSVFAVFGICLMWTYKHTYLCS